MVFENRRPLWGRLFSRLRRSQGEYSCNQQRSASRQHLRYSRSNASVLSNSSIPSRYIFAIRSPSTNFLTHGGRPLSQQSVNSSMQNFSPELIPFRQQAFPQTGFYVPKCLTEVDCHALLSGQTTYENFSENCWLENHLHRFGDAPMEDSPQVYETDSADSQADSENSIPSTQRARGAVPNWHNILDNIQVNISSADILDGSNENSGSPSPEPEVYYRGNISTISSGSGGTVSDITQFYNNMPLIGYGFSAQDFPDEPPPYTELPYDDPPPPYTSACPSHRNESSTMRRASTQILGQAILW